ncbi:alpha/beta hydrolase [Flavobacteriaceae bacterium S356]|uniref:Alpha/beta hydrolase n=1 Tax=Asprobacillus argus TaxID=3076534 RepID=A0ABU3LER4_9FLAO|nr:alpha/beta hydrolase [Flavobacteriaceae bacterium S356]
MRLFKKVLKITFSIVLLVFIGLYIMFYQFTKPKSDEVVMDELTTELVRPKLTKERFKNFEYRMVSVEKDSSLPTIVFVHGTIGSAVDFKSYLTDSLLLEKANMIAYDRVGYNYKDTHNVQESISFEAAMLDSIIGDRTNVILVGYSYGGPIALATKKTVKSIVLLAPAVYSKVEPMPSMINVYKWKLTRWLVPPIWKQASREKISHQEDLKKFEDHWGQTNNKVISIHGDADWIVPYSNSLFLEKQFSKDQFKLVTINNVSHELVWSNDTLIKQELLKLLN